MLFKLGRYDEAIAAWTRALAGDGDSIDRADIDRKIKAARSKSSPRSERRGARACRGLVLVVVASLCARAARR